MPEKTKEIKDRSQLNLNLDQDIIEKFRIAAKESGKTQAEYFCQLLNYYEEGCTDAQAADDGPKQISIVMYHNSLMNMRLPQKITFRGRKLYCSDSAAQNRVLDGRTANLLQVECPFKFYKDAYIFSYTIELFENLDKGGYIAWERFSVSLSPQYQGERTTRYDSIGERARVEFKVPADVDEQPLAVSRAGAVRNFDEFCNRFGKYVSNDDWLAICEILAEDIGDDYAALDDWFPDHGRSNL